MNWTTCPRGSRNISETSAPRFHSTFYKEHKNHHKFEKKGDGPGDKLFKGWDLRCIARPKHKR